MKNKNNNTLPMAAMKEVPTPNKNAKNIVGLVKEKGKVIGYQLEGGQMLTKEQGVSLAKEGGIQGVGIASRKGSEYLKSLPDGKDQNNLSNLPTVH